MPVFTVEKPDSVACGKIVRQARIKSGMSLRKFADIIGFSAPFVSDLELGRRSWKQETFQRAMTIINRDQNKTQPTRSNHPTLKMKVERR